MGLAAFSLKRLPVFFICEFVLIFLVIVLVLLVMNDILVGEKKFFESHPFFSFTARHYYIVFWQLVFLWRSLRPFFCLFYKWYASASWILGFFILKIQRLHQDMRMCPFLLIFYDFFSGTWGAPFSLQIEIFFYFKKVFISYTCECPPCVLFSSSGPPVLHMLASSYLASYLLSAIISFLLSCMLCDISQVCVTYGWHYFQQCWFFYYFKCSFCL